MSASRVIEDTIGKVRKPQAVSTLAVNIRKELKKAGYTIVPTEKS